MRPTGQSSDRSLAAEGRHRAAEVTPGAAFNPRRVQPAHPAGAPRAFYDPELWDIEGRCQFKALSRLHRTTEPSKGLMSDHIDKLAIDTIRTLSMDAVEKANSGHPGTPMALAPVVYTLLCGTCATTRPMRAGRTATASCSRPATPPCCSIPCCSSADVRGAAMAKRLTLDDIKKFRQLGSRTPGPPGIRAHPRRGDHHRAARPGLRRSASAWRWRRAGWRSISTATASRAVRLRRLRHLQRRRHDGGRLQRGGLARRPPEAFQPLLDLRPEPHLHRGPHRARLHEDVAARFARLWLERAARGRRQRQRGAGRGAVGVRGRPRTGRP